MITIKDISKLAKVSTATVSKVINGDYSKVSASTKKRILKIAKENNYKPNRLARSLVNQRTDILGLIVPDISNPYFAELARGVQDKAESFGYRVILCNADDNIEKEASFVDVLIEYNVDGIIISGNENGTDNRIFQLKDFGIPYVSIDKNLGENAYGIFIDDFKGSYLATEYILKNGHTKVAFIGGEGITEAPKRRLNGYFKAMEDYRVKINEDLIRLGSYHMETGYSYAKELFDKMCEFTAVVCGNDLIAFGVLKAIRENELHVPQDISVVGYDDIYLTMLTEPNLTTVKQPTYEIGHYAMNMLHKLIQKEPLEERVKLFVPKLIVRDSVRNILK